MVRRTREDALATRHTLLDAAELVFHAHGVSRTTLNDIAQQAGTTRGAIYWHFKDKADLFNAMMERVTLPLEATFQQLGTNPAEDALQGMRQAMLSALRQTETDERTRRVFAVATHKVEYVDELQAVRQRHLNIRRLCIEQTRKALAQAARQRGMKLPLPATHAAQGLHALIDGLIQNWLLEPGEFALLKLGQQAMDAYLAGLGLAPTEAEAKKKPVAGR